MFHKSRIPIGSIIRDGLLPSRVQRSIYRRRGYRIADDVQLAPGVVIEADEVEIGQGTRFGFATVIRGKSVRIGRRVEFGSFCFFEGRDISIGDDTVVREQVFVGGPLFPDSLFEVGKRVRIFQTCFLNPSKPLRIGDETGVGGRSSIFTHGSWQSVIDGYPVAFAPVTIGKNVWLPWHVFILPGVEIGDDATIGAGSVVNRSVPAGALAAGVPAKVLRGPEEWPRRIAPDEQWGIARSMFEEFLAYLEDLGVAVERAEADARLDAVVSHGRERHRIALLERADTAKAADHVIVALRGRPPGPSETQSWFTLRERRKGGPRTDISREVEDWLSRYGLRFAPVDES